jgi:murein DD-endopeptidase MepM/ murein hydrolase activator NlpD
MPTSPTDCEIMSFPPHARRSSTARHRAVPAPALGSRRLTSTVRSSLIALVCATTVTSGISPAQAAGSDDASSGPSGQRRTPAVAVTAPHDAVVAPQTVITGVLPPPAEPVAAATALARPATGEVTSDFGVREHPVRGGARMHTGVDFSAGDGGVYAAADGVVVQTATSGGYGLQTVVEHTAPDGSTWLSRYSHQSSFSVEPGDQVTRGQRIGTIGSTGVSTGPHLHFEVMIGGELTDPQPRIA